MTSAAQTTERAARSRQMAQAMAQATNALAIIAAGAAMIGLIGPALIGTAQAQLSPGRGPIAYSADTLEYREDARLLVLTGNVDVTQDNARLQADKITITFKPAGSAESANAQVGSGDIDRMVAEGRVFYVRPAQKARGDRAVYDTNSDTVTFTGNVVIASEENVTRSDTVVLEIGNQRTTFRPGAGKRVEGVIRPRSQQTKSDGR
jgi:lipopolysaccharide export system protein LptA